MAIESCLFYAKQPILFPENYFKLVNLIVFKLDLGDELRGPFCELLFYSCAEITQLTPSFVVYLFARLKNLNDGNEYYLVNHILLSKTLYDLHIFGHNKPLQNPPLFDGIQ